MIAGENKISANAQKYCMVLICVIKGKYVWVPQKKVHILEQYTKNSCPQKII
jgi:hypothetical protein